MQMSDICSYYRPKIYEGEKQTTSETGNSLEYVTEGHIVFGVVLK